MKRKPTIILLGMALTLICAEAAELPYMNSALPVEQRVDDLMSRMTLREKIGQQAQWTGDREKNGESNSGLDDLVGTLENAAEKEYATRIPAKTEMILKGEIGSFLKVPGIEAANYLQRVAEQSRLKIPLLIATDAIHGHGMYTQPTTIFPTQITLASSFTPSLAETMARLTAVEMRATGWHWTFSPNVEIVRDQRWGRTGETFGEDTLLATEMGVAMVRGYQGDVLSETSVLACAKHFAAGGEPFNGINAAETDISERTLHQVYLPPFKACVDAGCYTLMAAHNALNGIPCHAHKGLMTDLLRTKWGFKGFVVSDWCDVNNLHRVLRVATDYKDAARLAVDAGIDCHMFGGGFLDRVEALVKEGKLTEEQVDRGCRATLTAKFRLGLFESRYKDPAKLSRILLNKDHKKAALEMARKSIVLLKNENNLLPLRRNIGSVLVTGPNAASHAQLGDWSRPQPDEHVITLLEGIQNVISKRDAVQFVDCGKDFDVSKEAIEQAVAAAQQCEVAIVAVGESALRHRKWKSAGENCDYTTLQLPGNQLELIQAIKETGTPVVVVLINTRALAVSWCAENIPAILETWEPGSMGGQAAAEILFGEVNPSGRLPITMPRSVGHLKCYYNYTPLRLKRYGNSGIDPLFPFGHGLSYTTFKYGNLKCPEYVKKGDSAVVKLDVTNTGDRAGDEIVMLYMNDEFSSVTTPIKELKAFQRISLKPGERKSVTLTLPADAFSLIDGKLNRVIEPGGFSIRVGSLKGKIKIK